METPELKNIIIKIKVKKNKKRPVYDDEDKKTLFNKLYQEIKEIKKPDEIKKYSSSYFYELFGDKFIYCGIHLKTNGIKQNGKPKKTPTMPKNYDKIIHSTFKNWMTYETKLYTPNGIILLREQSKFSCIDIDEPDKCEILEYLLKGCNQIHKTKNGYHFLFKNNDLPSRQLCDGIDINTNLFFVPEYKNEHGETIGKYELIKNDGLIEMDIKIYEYCENLIKIKNNGVIKKEKKQLIKPIKQLSETLIKINEIFNLEIMNKIYEIHFLKGSFNNFNDWLSVCWIGRHLNNTEEGFNLFYEYGKKVPGYETEPKELIKSHFYQKNEYDKNFNPMKILKNARKLSNEKFIKEIDPLLYGNQYENKAIKFNSKFIYTKENEHIFTNFLESEKNILCFSSPYGTGKTYAFRQLIPNFKRILFITYRQSLAYTLYKDLKDENFLNYNNLTNEGIQTADRLIIQLDSVPRLNNINFITDENELPEYDLIIIDEIEGILSHFNATTLKNKRHTSELLTKLIQNTNKCLCLDGDINNRSLDFLENTIKRDFLYYVNEFKPVKKKIIFTRSINYFNKVLDENIKNDKKVVLCSMRCNKTMEYKQKYSDLNYNVICHNGIEKNNAILKDFKNKWGNADLLMYSPTIEAGVDYDNEHFNCCMGFMSNGSTSARAFSQMLHRVRHTTENEILIFIGTLKYDKNAMLYYADSLEKNLLENYDTKSGLGNIQKYNKVEELNSTNFLLNDFINIIERKGYEWEILEQEKNEIDDDTYDYQTRIGGIVDARILENDKQYNVLINKQKEGTLCEEQTYILDKYFLSKKFLIDIDKIDGVFVELHFRKEYIIDNYNKFDSKEPVKKNLDNNLLSEKIDKINEIFKMFKDNEGNKKELKADELRKNLSEFLKNPYLRNLFKTLPNGNNPKKIFTNVENHILDELGMSFIKTRRRYRDEITKQRKTEFFYTLGYGEILKGYFERKQEKEKEEEQQALNDIDGI
jgi:hypothetical protein